MILRNAYNDPKASDWLSPSASRRRSCCCRSRSAARPEAKDLFGLFDDTLARLLAAAQKK